MQREEKARGERHADLPAGEAGELVARLQEGDRGDDQRGEAEPPGGDRERTDPFGLGEAGEDGAEGDRGETDAEDDEGEPAGGLGGVGGGRTGSAADCAIWEGRPSNAGSSRMRAGAEANSCTCEDASGGAGRSVTQFSRRPHQLMDCDALAGRVAESTSTSLARVIAT